MQDSNFNRNGLHQEDLLERFKDKNHSKVSFLKLLTKENLLEYFILACNLAKNDVKIPPVKISSKKVRANNTGFYTIKITSKKVRGNDVDFWIIEITSKKNPCKWCGFFDQQNYIKKVRGNDIEIRQNLILDVST